MSLLSDEDMVRLLGGQPNRGVANTFGFGNLPTYGVPNVMTADGPAPQRGRICMDMSMIDLTDLPGVQVGDEVEIFGCRARVDDLAALAGTIPYELTCAVSKRVPRVYLQGGKVVEKELLLRM